MRPTRRQRRSASATARRRAGREAQHRRRIEAWLNARYPRGTDHTGPAGSEETFAPRMSGGSLRQRTGLDDAQLQRAWERRCGPQPPGVPRLHEDADFAASEAGWVRRRKMVDDLRGLIR